MVKKAKNAVVWQRIGGLALGIAVLVYAVYHVSSLFGEDISTITTGLSTETTVIDGKGYVFRDETVLYSEHSGVADYLKADGTKVSVNEALANVGENGSGTSKSMVRYLDGRIDILRQSVESGLTLANLPEVNDNVSDAYYSLAKMIASGDSGGISAQADKLLLNMNCHSLLTDESSPVDDTLDKMISQRDGIINGGGDSVTEYATDSGYFYSYVDGFEQYFTADAADSLSAKDFYTLTEDVKADADAIASSYGKLSSNSEWRFVMKMSSVAAEYFEKDATYRLRFVENGNVTIPMTLMNTVEDDMYGGVLLVFYANRLPDGFVFDRCQSVSVEVSSFSGIYVPKSAVHRMGGQYCVYVLRGSVVSMRRIDVVYEATDYYLCAADVKSDGGVEYLGANELLIIKGSNLFDGRILD